MTRSAADRTWMTQEERTLRSMVQDGCAHKIIARELDRTPESIRKRVQYLGISPRRRSQNYNSLKTILDAVADRHQLPVSDLLGPDKSAHLMAARREAISIMHGMGSKPGAIASVMNRERTTILEYTNPERAAYKRAYRAGITA